MKLKFSRIIPVISVYTLMALASCTDEWRGPCLQGNGNIVEETRVLKNFNSLELNIPADVFVREGSESSVIIEADWNLMAHLETVVIGEKLFIQSRRCFRSDDNRITVYLDMKEIREFSANGSGNITVEDIFPGNSLLLSINGSGNITVPCETASLRSVINGSGNIHLEGYAASHKISISGSGQVRAWDMENENCEIRIAGSGNGYVLVNNHLDVNISGSGSVYYKGSPHVNSSISGSGKTVKVSS